MEQFDQACDVLYGGSPRPELPFAAAQSYMLCLLPQAGVSSFLLQALGSQRSSTVLGATLALSTLIKENGVQCLRSGNVTISCLCKSLFIYLPNLHLDELLFQQLGKLVELGERSIVSSLCKLIAVVIRMWFSISLGVQSEVLNAPFALVNSTEGPRKLVGADLLREIVLEMQPHSGYTNQRKLCASFRNNSLLDIFKAGFILFEQSFDDPSFCNLEFRFSTVRLLYECLNYDFSLSGFNQNFPNNHSCLVPSSWTILKEPATLKLFFRAVLNGGGLSGWSTELYALQCLKFLARLKRRMFPDPLERREFLHTFIEGIVAVMAVSNITIDHPQYTLNSSFFDTDEANTYLWDTLVSIKANSSFTELYLQHNFRLLLDAAFSYTSISLYRYHSLMFGESSLHFLEFWSRVGTSLVSSSIAQRTPEFSEFKELLKQKLHDIFSEYVNAKLVIVDKLGDLEGFSDDDVLLSYPFTLYLSGEMDQVQSLIRSNPSQMAAIIASQLEPRCSTLLQFITAGNPACEETWEEYLKLESAVSYLVYFSGCVVNLALDETCVSSFTDTSTVFGIVKCILDLMDTLDSRWIQGSKLAVLYNWPAIEFSTKINLRLELAFLQFLHIFHERVVESKLADSVPEVLHTEDVMETSANLKKLRQIVDSKELLDVVASKVFHNLRFYVHSEELINSTMDILEKIVYGVKVNFECDLPCVLNNGNFLLGCESITKILASVSDLEFLNDPKYIRYRSMFYRTISNLYFLQSGEVIGSQWDSFVSNIDQTSMQISAIMSQGPLDDSGMFMVIGYLRDLRGIVQSSIDEERFSAVFPWFCTTHAPLLQRIGIELVDNHRIVVVLFKVVRDLVANLEHKIQADDVNDIQVIVVFRIASYICLPTIQKMLPDCINFQETSDEHLHKFFVKISSTFQGILHHELFNTFLPIGIITYYNDQAMMAISQGLELTLCMKPSFLIVC